MKGTDPEPRWDEETGDIRLLRSFVAVAREGSFTAAATLLHLTQQAVSAHVRRLERQLGVRLLERTTRHVALTPIGVEFVSSARSVLVLVEEMWDRTRDSAGMVTGLVRVGLTAAAGNQVAPELVAALRQTYPDVELLMIEEPMPILLNDLRKGDLDIGLVLAPGNDHGLDGWPLIEGPMEVLISRQHPHSRYQRVTVSQLRDLILLVPRRDGNTQLHYLASEFAKKTGQLRTMVSLADSTLPDEVYSGTAYALWPTVLPAKHVPSGLTTIQADVEIGTVGIWLLHRPTPPGRAVAAVIDTANQRWPRP